MRGKRKEQREHRRARQLRASVPPASAPTTVPRAAISSGHSKPTYELPEFRGRNKPSTQAKGQELNGLQTILLVLAAFGLIITGVLLIGGSG